MMWIAAFLALAAVAQQSYGAECNFQTFQTESGKAYFINEAVATSLSEANSNCKLHGGSLASITSEEQYREIKDILAVIRPEQSVGINAIHIVNPSNENPITWGSILDLESTSKTNSIYPTISQPSDPTLVVTPEKQMVAVFETNQSKLVEMNLQQSPLYWLCQVSIGPSQV